MYTTVKSPTEIELVVERSRFIAAVARADDAAAAEGFIAERRSRFHDARHNCWAYVIDGGLKRRSDDGEPSGTAGVPILNVLERQGLSHVAVVVTRYFGGVLLGAGRLARTYGRATVMAVEAAGRLDVVPMCLLTLAVPYDLTGVAERWLERHADVRLLRRDYGDGATLTVEMPEAAAPTYSDEWCALGLAPAESATVGSEE